MPMRLDLMPPGMTQNGTADDDKIEGGDGNDVLSGEEGHDIISGGAGNDTLYGDKGDGISAGNDASALVLDINNLESETYAGRNADVGDSAVYRDITTLEDGTSVWGRLVLTDKSDDSMRVDLSGGKGAEILMNGRGTGDEASFRLEFFNPETGEPVALNSIATFNDIDSNRNPDDVEAVTLDSGSFTAFGTSEDTSLDVTSEDGEVRAKGTESNNPDDEDAWFSAKFEDRTFIEFTLESRDTNSGFTLSGDMIEDAVYSPIEQGDDTLIGGEGDDVAFGGGGDDSLDGGEGDDCLVGGSGDDVAVGGTGDDTLSGGDGADTLSGGDGADLIQGGAGNDVLESGSGDDSLDGGSGDDVMTGGAGDDVITGGSGDDTFGFSDGSGADTITDFDLGDSDGDGFTNDQFDVSELTGGSGPGGSVTAWDVKVEDDGDGNALLLFPGGESVVLKGVKPEQIDSASEMHAAGIPCFTPGTLIETEHGEQRVETLCPGDKVRTRDNGLQPVLWVGEQVLGADELRHAPELRPVVIRKNALGNRRRMLVSPQHAFLIGQRLVRAKHLAEFFGGTTARVERHAMGVTYRHVLTPRHELIRAEGAWTETLYPGPVALAALGNGARQSLTSALPSLATLLYDRADHPTLRLRLRAIYGLPARPYARRSELRRAEVTLDHRRLPETA